MTDTNTSHDTEIGSIDKGISYQNSDQENFKPRWQLPESGIYAVSYWAKMYDVTEKTICEWIVKHKIPFIGSAAKNSFIDAHDFLTYMRREYKEDDE